MPLPWMNRPPLYGRGSVPFTALTGGVHTEKNPSALEPGEFTEISNAIVTPRGIQRQAPFEYAITEANNVSPSRSIFTGYPRSFHRAFTSANASIGVLFTSTKLYKLTDFTSTALAEVYWGCRYIFPATGWDTGALWGTAPLAYTYPGSVHTITFTTAPSGSINFDGTDYTVDYGLKDDMFIKVGDTITFSVNSSLVAHANDFTAVVLTVTNTVMTLGSVSGTPSGNYRGMTMRRVATTDAITSGHQFIDTTYAENTLVATGIDMPLSKYDTGTNWLYRLVSIGESNGNDYYYPTNLTASSSANRLLTFSAATVAYFKNRLWVGYLKDKTGTYKNRIRWSNPLDPLDDWSDTVSYIDIPTESEIVKLIPLGEYLMVFCAEAIFYGYSVSIPLLPLAFNSINMLGVGLVGPRAVCAAADGLFFVGHNDIYFMNGLQPVAIGTPILRETLNQIATWDLSLTQVTHDPDNKRIVILFMVNTSTAGTTWSFNYESKAWSKAGGSDSLFISNYHVSNRTYLMTANKKTSGASDYKLLKSGLNTTSVYYDLTNSLVEYNELDMTIITGDISLDHPDVLKDWYRLELSVAAYSALSYQLNFACYVYLDGSTTAVGLGTLSIYTGKTTGSLDFRAHGKSAKFKLTWSKATAVNSTNYVPVFTIDQFIVDVKAIAPYKAIK